MSFTKKVTVAAVTLALATGGLAMAAGVSSAHSHHHSHDSDSGDNPRRGDEDSRRAELSGRPDPQGVGGPEATASDFTPAGVPVVGTAQAAAGATKALPSGPEGDGQSGGGY